MSGIEKRVFTVLIFIFSSAFLVLSMMVLTGYTTKVDLDITSWFYNVRGEYGGTIYFLLRIFTELGHIYILVPLIIVMAIFWKFDNRAFCLGFGTLFVYLFNEFVKLLYQRPRPTESLRWMHEASTSFPSGHAMTSMFAYGFILYFLLRSHRPKKEKIMGSVILTAIIVIVCITRLGLGVHYFSDVIGGLFLGFVGIMIVLFIYDHLYSLGFEFILGLFHKNKGNIKK